MRLVTALTAQQTRRPRGGSTQRIEITCGSYRVRVERPVPAAAVPDGLGAYHQAGSAEARALAPGRAQDTAVLVEGRRRS